MRTSFAMFKRYSGGALGAAFVRRLHAGPGEAEAGAALRRWFGAGLGVLAATAALTAASLPSGAEVSPAALRAVPGALERIDVYCDYLQLHFTDGPRYVGVTPNDSRTDRIVREILEQASGRAEPHTDAEPGRVTVEYVGTSYSEWALSVIESLLWLTPLLFIPVNIIGIGRMLRSAMAPMGSQSGNPVIDKQMFKVTPKTSTRFHHIAGMKEAKLEVQEIVDFLKHPEKFEMLGTKIPKGCLLLGVPGTGKTMLAKAVAGESDVTFIPCTGSDFAEMYAGMGARRVRQLFKLANEQKGSVVIYIDEIDAIGLKRSGTGFGEKQEQEHTLNELLIQLDGFKKNSKIVLIGSSNVNLNQLDPALTRPGRFDRIIHIEPPIFSERQEIFLTHLNKLKLAIEDVPNKEPLPNFDTQEELNTEEIRLQNISNDIINSNMNTSTTNTETNTNITEISKNTTGTNTISEGTNTNTKETNTISEGANTNTTGTNTISEGANTNTTGTNTNTTGTNTISEGANTNTTGTNTTSAEPIIKVLSNDQKLELMKRYSIRMSELCPGFVGADISNVVNEAALLAARLKHPYVCLTHLEKSIDRVLAGIEMQSRVLSRFEKEVVAHHEAGHAIVGWYFSKADPLMKVSIVPRSGKALGYAQYLPRESHIRSNEDMYQFICVALGGRAAEEVFFKHLSTGASDDLLKVTKYAYAIASSYINKGLSYQLDDEEYIYRKPFGTDVQNTVDVKAMEIIKNAYKDTIELLRSKREETSILAQHLIRFEVLTKSDVIKYLGDRPISLTSFRIA